MTYNDAITKRARLEAAYGEYIGTARRNTYPRGIVNYPQDKTVVAGSVEFGPVFKSEDGYIIVAGEVYGMQWYYESIVAMLEDGWDM